MKFSGEPRKAARRVDSFLEQLRGPGGWKDVSACLPSGGSERISIGPDKNTKTVRTEVQTKKLHNVLSQLYPQHTFYPQRRDGVVAANYRPVVKLDVRPEGTKLLFNQIVLTDMGIDKAAVLAAWEAAAAPASQSVEWQS